MQFLFVIFIVAWFMLSIILFLGKVFAFLLWRKTWDKDEPTFLNWDFDKPDPDEDEEEE